MKDCKEGKVHSTNAAQIIGGVVNNKADSDLSAQVGRGGLSLALAPCTDFPLIGHSLIGKEQAESLSARAARFISRSPRDSLSATERGIWPLG